MKVNLIETSPGSLGEMELTSESPAEREKLTSIAKSGFCIYAPGNELVVRAKVISLAFEKRLKAFVDETAMSNALVLDFCAALQKIITPGRPDTDDADFRHLDGAIADTLTRLEKSLDVRLRTKVQELRQKIQEEMAAIIAEDENM